MLTTVDCDSKLICSQKRKCGACGAIGHTSTFTLLYTWMIGYDTDLNTQRRTEIVLCSVSPLATPLSAFHLPTLLVATRLAMEVLHL